jgi:hypothetical protein
VTPVKPLYMRLVFGEATNQGTWPACVSHFVFPVRLRRLLREDALARLAQTSVSIFSIFSTRCWRGWPSPRTDPRSWRRRRAVRRVARHCACARRGTARPRRWTKRRSSARWTRRLRSTSRCRPPWCRAARTSLHAHRDARVVDNPRAPPAAQGDNLSVCMLGAGPQKEDGSLEASATVLSVLNDLKAGGEYRRYLQPRCMESDVCRAVKLPCVL